ncbi:MAG: hypothetical protein A2Z38_06485 [Planctomycetes bacterium RBG_19FT_COMBO_48_8]|nr:MAG: hypothetical protein A2Z38_06485 [Planctomycetes bacterium RBG_19FT_COMBO_48_8]
MNQGNHTGVPLQQTHKDDAGAVSVVGVLPPDFLNFSLDKIEGSCFNVNIMRQINRKNTGNWWWPVG